MSSCSVLSNTESSTDAMFTDCAIRENNFKDKTYTKCVFKQITFQNCSFENVKFIKCEFHDVQFTSCKSISMVIKDSEFTDSMILKSKFRLTSITKTNFSNFRFYNSIFLDTKFKDSNITGTLLENSSFVKTSMIDVILISVSMILIDFRNSSFKELYFEYDVDIQKSNFENCTFDESHLGSPHVTETIFDGSYFTSVLYTSNSEILNCSFENVSYQDTKIISITVSNNQLWLPIALDMSGSVSERPQILSNTRTRFFPMISRLYGNTSDVGPITHIPGPPVRRTHHRLATLRTRQLVSSSARTALSTLRTFRDLDSMTTPAVQNLPTRSDPRHAGAIVDSIARLTTASAELFRMRQQLGPEATPEHEQAHRQMIVRQEQMFGQDDDAVMESRRELIREEVRHQSQKTEELRERLQKLNIKFGITNVTISEEQTAFELFDGEVPLQGYLTRNPETIAFFFQNNYYIATRENLITMISVATVDNMSDNSIVFECKIANTMREDNIVFDNPLLKIASIGIATNKTYLPLTEMLLILADERKDIKYRIYELVPTEKDIQSVVSFQILLEMTDHASASHCQSGQGGKMYKIRKMRNVSDILSNFVSKYRNKTKKNSGGKSIKKNGRGKSIKKSKRRMR